MARAAREHGDGAWLSYECLVLSMLGYGCKGFHASVWNAGYWNLTAQGSGMEQISENRRLCLFMRCWGTRSDSCVPIVGQRWLMSLFCDGV